MALSLDLYIYIIEPAHDKTYNKTCATSEDSDQPAHPRSLIRVFADRIFILDHPKMDKRKPLPYWLDVQADMSLAGYTDLIIDVIVAHIVFISSYRHSIQR